MDGGGDAQERKDAGQKRGGYNSKHGLLGREYPRAYRSTFAFTLPVVVEQQVEAA